MACVHLSHPALDVVYDVVAGLDGDPFVHGKVSFDIVIPDVRGSDDVAAVIVGPLLGDGGLDGRIYHVGDGADEGSGRYDEGDDPDKGARHGEREGAFPV